MSASNDPLHPAADVSTAAAPRLMVVDDDPATGDFLREWLSAVYSVQTLTDGQTALAAIRRGPPPDLVLCDVFMPGGDGLALLRALRDDPATAALPVLLMTGNPDEETTLRGFKAGADDFILKPLRPQILLARVRTHLDLARLRRDDGAQRLRAIAERSLRDSEERFRAIVNQAMAGVVEIDPEGRFTLVNRKFCDLLGYSEAELLRLKISDITHPDDYPHCLELFQRTLATGEPVTNEKRHVRKDGRIMWISDSLSLIRAEGAKPPRVVAVIIDVTERKIAEEALRRSEEHFRLVVTSVREYAIFTLDAQGRVTTWNEVAERLKGYSAVEIIGRPCAIFSMPEDIAAGLPERQLVQAVTDGVAPVEAWRVRKDGTRFWGEELLFPMRGEAGGLLGFVKICRDMSERKATEDERARLLAAEQTARREAEAANAAKDRFLAAMSHELRTPLVPVQMSLYILEREAALGDTARNAVEMIKRNVALETRLIADLLDVSRIMNGKLELEPGSASLHACVHGGLDFRRAEIEARQLELTVALEASDDRVQGDAARLRQVFDSLIGNAVKFSAPGDRITVRSRNAGNSVIVEVHDTGVGIGAEALPSLFDAFAHRVSDTGRPCGGLGLGLTISLAIVHTLGGRLTAASPGPGRGATFTVELPL